MVKKTATNKKLSMRKQFKQRLKKRPLAHLGVLTEDITHFTKMMLNSFEQCLSETVPKPFLWHRKGTTINIDEAWGAVPGARLRTLGVQGSGVQGSSSQTSTSFLGRYFDKKKTKLRPGPAMLINVVACVFEKSNLKDFLTFHSTEEMVPFYYVQHDNYVDFSSRGWAGTVSKKKIFSIRQVWLQGQEVIEENIVPSHYRIIQEGSGNYGDILTSEKISLPAGGQIHGLMEMKQKKDEEQKQKSKNKSRELKAGE